MFEFVCWQLISEKTKTRIISSAKCLESAILRAKSQLTPYLGFLEKSYPRFQEFNNKSYNKFIDHFIVKNNSL